MTTEELTRLFQQYGNDVYRFAYSITRHTADAEDICQTIFCRLAKGNIVLEPGREKAWLLQCAANACRDRFRFLGRWKTAPLEEAVHIPDDTQRAVLDAVMALPAKYRAPVHLYYYEGYSQKKIARILSLSLTTVQTRMQRARNLLRKELCNDEINL
ncbi:MAG: RNA polymerase sigma factor [Lachnospiraceae bacterium]|jgi:RNA polymerase sigma-70 factor (ECF subfamily)|nr:RNA polymerase sigma factor [Lachnospiraceae bacterium]